MKIFKTVFVLLMLTSAIVFAQENSRISISENQSKPTVISFENEAKAKFDHDLKSNNLKIYLLGGIKSVIQKEDAEFGKKYKIQYYDFGCTPSTNFKVYEQYNHLVFNHLMQEHGKKWIALTNQNAFGILKWKAANLKL